MGLPNKLDVPKIRGVATIRVLGPDGELKAEQTGENLLNNRFWDGLLMSSNGSYTYSSSSLYNIRTYIGSDKTIPNPYEDETLMIGEGTDHPAGVFSRGAEPITDYPYIQIRNLYQVTGTARTIYSIGLFSNAGDPLNEINNTQDCVTRLLLPTPVIQGANDQIDLTYRLYFEEDSNSPTHPAYWATLVDWAMSQNSSTTLHDEVHRSYGCVLGMGGIGYNQHTQSTSFPTYGTYNSNLYGGQWLRPIDSRVFNVSAPNITMGRWLTKAHHYWDTSFRTNKNYMYGELFNEWWPRDRGIEINYTAWLGSDSGIQGTFIYQHSANKLTKFHKDETSSSGPFHNSFNFSSTADSLVYDVDNLPQTTWRAVFGGTWPATDKYPLFARLWWDNSGAVDGSAAKYKLGFVRSLGTSNGKASDERYAVRGNELKGSRSNGYSRQDQAFPGQTYWSLESDLASGHTEYENSRFGNLGFYNASGITARYYSNDYFFATSYSTKRVFNTRKVVGLTTNTWWGWQSGKYGKSTHLGVEFRKLVPFERKVWQKNDINTNLNQIDWLEAVNGMPGEVDDEMCVIVDKTSGVYLINATQDTVTQLTTTTGLDQCTVSRDPSTGNLIYTGIKFDTSDILFYESSNNWQETDLFYYGRGVGGSESPTNTSTPAEFFSRSNEGSNIIFTSGYNWPSSVNSSNLKANQDKLQRASLYYDGTSDSLRAYTRDSDSNYFDIGANEDFTFEVWVKISEFLNDQTYRLILDYDDLHINMQENYGVKIGSNEMASFYDSSTDTIGWDHLAVVRESGTVTTYKNGSVHDVLKDSSNNVIADTTALSPGAYVGMGGRRTYSSDSLVMKGYLQQVRITKSARYSGAFTPEDFTDKEASNDTDFSNTLLNWTTEVQPLSITDAGANLENGIHSGLATSGSATGSGLTVNVVVESNAVTSIAVEDRGSDYRTGDTVTVTIPATTGQTATPLEITIDSVATRLGSWWTSYGHRTVIIRRHWRHPDVFVGLFQSGSYNYAYYFDLNAENAESYSNALSQNVKGYIGEFFGDQGEDSGITEFGISDAQSYLNQREVAWADWIQFEPNGLVARTIELNADTSTSHWKQKQSVLIKTQRTYTSNRYEILNNCGADPWTAPHSILEIPNSEDSNYPHYVIGNRRNYSSDRYQYNRHSGDTPLIIKGGNRTTADSAYESRQSVVTNMTDGNVDYYGSAGEHQGQYPTPGAGFAQVTDSTSTGVYKESNYEKYKGLALDGGNVNFYAPMWCGRDDADITTNRAAFPGAWPIDPENDEVIPHPLRWDIYGWDSSSSTWVREEWAYNYTDHKWVVDTATVKPGRPAPNGGGTHSLSGISESPYNGLTVTFSDVRPEDTNDPIQGEWSGQFIYNGCVMDGITEFTFATTVSNRPITIKTINQTIPSSGVITAPEALDDSFISLLYLSHYYDLEIDGENASIDFTLDHNETVDEGTISVHDYQLNFNSNDIGKTLTGTYAVVNFANSETPSNWVWWAAGHSESVNATTTGLLGGNSYKDSTTLVSEGWTMETESNTRVEIQASSYPNEFPDGFAYLRQPSPHITGGHYAETILISRDNIGFFWHDGQSSITYRDYLSSSSDTSNPKYGGMQWMYDDNHQLTCVHSRLYTDANGDNWLVIRSSWTHSTSTLTDPRIVSELWISVDDPFTYEVRFGEWTNGLFDLYTYWRYMGITHTAGGYKGLSSTAMTENFPRRMPYGAAGNRNNTDNINNSSPWGGNLRVEYPNHKYEIDLDPHDYE